MAALAALQAADRGRAPKAPPLPSWLPRALGGPLDAPQHPAPSQKPNAGPGAARVPGTPRRTPARLPQPKQLSKADEFGWLAPPDDVSVANLWESLIGREVARDQYIDSQIRKRQLREQSEAVVRRLESQGIAGRQKDNGVTLIGMCSGLADRAIDFRNSNIIPTMQARNVHGIMTHVRYYLDQVDRRQLRMFVASAGWVPMAGYREAHKRFCRQISKLAADHRLRRLYKIDIVYFSVENTIQRGDDGQVMLNLHAHMIVRAGRVLGPKRWREMMACVAAHFDKGYVHDSPIAKAAECVKYVFKPAEFDTLSDGEFAELFRQTRRLKFYHPLGVIRDFRRQLDEAGLKLVMVPTVDDRMVWRTVARPKQPPAPEQTDDEKRQDIAFDLMLQPGDPGVRVRADEPNQFMGITVPSPMFTPRYEPSLVVRNYDGDFAALMKQQKVRDYVDRARAIDAARRAASIEDTTTTTVRRDVHPVHKRPPRPPPDEARRLAS